MASFIELIAKIKQKNNGTFKLVDAQDVECEDGKGLDEVLNEKLDKNQGVENAGKTMVVGADGNLVVGDSSPKNVYTKEEVDYLLDDKMDKPYVPIEITDNATITDALEGNFKIDKIKGNTYQNVETDIVPTPNRPVPINSRKVKVNSEYVELRSLKETGNLFDINFIKLFGNYSDGMTILDDGTVKITNNDATLWPLKTKSITIPKSANYTIKYDFETISGGANSGWISLVNMSNDNPKIFSTSGKTLYLDAGDYYVRFYRGQGATDVENNIVQYSNIVLVEGTSAPPTYVPPTIRDYKIVDHATQTSKIVRNVVSKQLEQNDITGMDSNYAIMNGFGFIGQEKIAASYSDKMSYVVKGQENQLSNLFTYSGAGLLELYIKDYTTLEEYRNWVEQNKPIMQTAAKTPTEEEIAYSADDVSEVGYSWQDTTSPSPTIKSETKGVEEIDVLKTGKNLVNGYDNFTLLKSGTYYLSTNNSNVKTRLDFGLYDENKELIRENIVSFVGSQFYLQSNGTYRLTNDANVIKSKITFDDERVKFIKIIYIDIYVKFDEIQLEVSDTATAYEPYTEQRVNYTPTNPLYSTQDGNIYDYVDVKKGVEVYNMSGAVVFDGSNDENIRYYEAGKKFYISANNILRNSVVDNVNLVSCDSYKYDIKVWNNTNI